MGIYGKQLKKSRQPDNYRMNLGYGISQYIDFNRYDSSCCVIY